MSLSVTIRAEREASALARREELLALLRAHHGNHRAAARAVGIHVNTLRLRLRGAGITAAEIRAAFPLPGRQPRTGERSEPSA